MKDTTMTETPAPCAPPPNAKNGDHWLEVDDNIHGTVHRIASWNGGMWLLGGSQFTPNMIASFGYRYHSPVPAPEEVEVLRANHREAWAAFGMLRETIEALGPVASLRAEEEINSADGPTFMAHAAELVRGIQKIDADRKVCSDTNAYLNEATARLAKIAADQSARLNGELGEIQEVAEALRRVVQDISEVFSGQTLLGKHGLAVYIEALDQWHLTPLGRRALGGEG